MYSEKLHKIINLNFENTDEEMFDYFLDSWLEKVLFRFYEEKKILRHLHHVSWCTFSQFPNPLKHLEKVTISLDVWLSISVSESLFTVSDNSPVSLTSVAQINSRSSM